MSTRLYRLSCCYLIVALGLPTIRAYAAAPEAKPAKKPEAAAPAAKPEAKPSTKPAAKPAIPRSTTTPLNRDVDRHKLINERAKAGNVDLLFIGDSITAGWEGNGKEAWAKYYGSRKAMNAGIGGDRTQHILWRLENGNIDGLKPKLAVIMIGTNNSGDNTSEEIADGIKAIVAKLRKELPEMKILLLGVFPRGADAADAKRKVNEGTNAIVKSLDDGKMVNYLDIGPSFLNADGVLTKEIMYDLLHLTPAGYEIWAKSIEPKVAELLGEMN